MGHRPVRAPGDPPSIPSLPLILDSGSLTPDLVLELERTTAIKCLPKPFSLAELLGLLPRAP